MPHTSRYTGQDAIAGTPTTQAIPGGALSKQGKPLKVGPAGPVSPKHVRKEKGVPGKGQKYY